MRSIALTASVLVILTGPGTLSSAFSATRLAELPASDQAEIERLCLPEQYLKGAAAFRDCVSREVAAHTPLQDAGAGSLSFDDQYAIQQACVDTGARGSAANQACVDQQVATISNEPAPDLNQLSTDEKYTVQQSCFSDQRNSGALAYRRCINAQIDSLVNLPQANLAALSIVKRNTLQFRCSATSDSAADYRQCLLAEAGIAPPSVVTLTDTDVEVSLNAVPIDNAAVFENRNPVVPPASPATAALSDPSVAIGDNARPIDGPTSGEPVDIVSAENDSPDDSVEIVTAQTDPLGESSDAESVTETAPLWLRLRDHFSGLGSSAKWMLGGLALLPVALLGLWAGLRRRRRRDEEDHHHYHETSAAGRGNRAHETPEQRQRRRLRKLLHDDEQSAEEELELHASEDALTDEFSEDLSADLTDKEQIRNAEFDHRISGFEPEPDPQPEHNDEFEYEPEPEPEPEFESGPDAEAQAESEYEYEAANAPGHQPGHEQDQAFGQVLDPGLRRGPEMDRAPVPAPDPELSPEAGPESEHGTEYRDSAHFLDDEDDRTQRQPRAVVFEDQLAPSNQVAEAGVPSELGIWLEEQSSDTRLQHCIEFLIYWVAYGDERYHPDLRQRLFLATDLNHHDRIKRWVLQNDVLAFADVVAWIRRHASRAQKSQLLDLLMALLLTEHAVTPVQNTILRFLGDVFDIEPDALEARFEDAFGHPMPALPRVDRAIWWEKQGNSALGRWDSALMANRSGRERLAARFGLFDDPDDADIIQAFRRAARRCHPNRFQDLSDRERALAVRQFSKYEEARDQLLGVTV